MGGRRDKVNNQEYRRLAAALKPDTLHIRIVTGNANHFYAGASFRIAVKEPPLPRGLDS